MTEEKKFTCRICGRERDEDLNCGGDCLYCMADLGDPDCVQRVFKECVENHGYRSIDSLLVSNRIENQVPHVESTKEKCDQCGSLVWASTASKASVIQQAEKDGGKYYFLCMQCVPDDLEKEVTMGPEQKAEMLAAGLDIDKFLAESGLTLEQVGQKMLASAKHEQKFRELIRNIAARCKEEGPHER